MLAKSLFTQEDEDHLIALRRELHMYPEVDFELPKTLALVKRELDKLDIPYTDTLGESSIVGYINKGSNGPVIALRADMDALRITEKVDLPFKSRVEGRMHACGHDAHTAILLTTARVLKRNENLLKCTVKLIFQANEENSAIGGGASKLVRDGVMDDVDVILGLHIETKLEAGKLGVCPGKAMAASNPITLNFKGRTTHATLPQMGQDALAMAVKTYTDIQFMLTRLNPLELYVLSVGCLKAGEVDNIIPDSALMKLSLRTFDEKLNDLIDSKIRMIAEHNAQEMGGTVEIDSGIKYFVVNNDEELSLRVRKACEKVVGEENFTQMPLKLGSEDFSYYLLKKRGVFFRVGIKNEECCYGGHSNLFRVDEPSLKNGCMAEVQFILDNQETL